MLRSIYAAFIDLHLPKACLVFVAACTSGLALASEPVVELYNAEKSHIANAYKDAVKQCAAKGAEDKVRCEKGAAQARREALKAASRERDVGLSCPSCGKVTRIEAVSSEATGSTTGAVVGGVAGAVVGRTVARDSSSSTKNVATAVGAVGGTLIGNKVGASGNKAWLVHYSLYDGQNLQKSYSAEPPFKVGDKIKADGERLQGR